jgi:hypothetical protein
VCIAALADDGAKSVQNEVDRESVLIAISYRPSTILPDSKPTTTVEEFRMLKATHAQYVKSRMVLMAALRKPEVGRLPMIKNAPEGQVAWLQERLQVSFPGDAEIMMLSLPGGDREQAVKLLNAVADAYIQEIVDRDKLICHQKAAQLSKALSRKDSEIRRKERLLGNLRDQLGGADANTQARAREESLMYQRELLLHRLQLVGAEARLKGLEGLLHKARERGDEEKRELLEAKIEEMRLKIAELGAQVGLLADMVKKCKDETENLVHEPIEVKMLSCELNDLKAVRRKLARERARETVNLEAPPRIRVVQTAMLAF